jgi:serine O-acetyltransferase
MPRSDSRSGRDADQLISSDAIDRTVSALAACGGSALSKAACEGLPRRAEVIDWIERTLQLILAQCERPVLRSEIPQLAGRLLHLIEGMSLRDDLAPRELVERFLSRLADVRTLIAEDVEAAFEGDPAARSFAEIVVAYPGLRAVAIQRIAHELQTLGVPILPRMMTEHAHSLSGIDIHPGACIGRRFFVDHGTGVVIGETTEIGDNVRIYQGVTLGALSPRHGESLRGQKRHPTIEDDVTIYAGVTILGGGVVIGRGSVIGGNVWLTESVPAGSKVVAEAPRTLVRQRGAGPSGSGAPPQPDWDI